MTDNIVTAHKGILRLRSGNFVNLSPITEDEAIKLLRRAEDAVEVLLVNGFQEIKENV